QQLLEVVELADAAPHVDVAVHDGREAGRIVAPVLEAAEPVDQDPARLLLADVTHDPAHDANHPLGTDEATLPESARATRCFNGRAFLGASSSRPSRAALGLCRWRRGRGGGARRLSHGFRWARVVVARARESLPGLGTRPRLTGCLGSPRGRVGPRSAVQCDRSGSAWVVGAGRDRGRARLALLFGALSLSEGFDPAGAALVGLGVEGEGAGLDVVA